MRCSPVRFSLLFWSLVASAGGLVTAVDAGAQVVASQPRTTDGYVAKPPVRRQAPASQARPFERPEHILKWMDGYRVKPEPQRLPEAVKAMSALGLFKDTETAAVYVGFLAGVFSQDRAQAEKLIAEMFPLPPEDQVPLIRAIAYSSLADWKDVLRKFSERMPARAVMIDRFMTDKLPTLDKLSMEESPAGLDTLWGFYYATGRREPVLRIVGLLEWSQDRNNADRLTIGSMAKWTLANNATRDVELLRILKGEIVQRPKPVREPLEEVIEAAETFETTKIRKQAMAALEELKTKGPQSTRNAHWWAQAGSTVFALGCVAASAMGQVQFGIPCVVGGPLGTAAARYLLPQ
jgi:hypothetical protein